MPILFKRYEHQLPLARAIPGGDISLLKPFVNVGANKTSKTSVLRQHLLFVQVLSYLIAEISHPVLAMYGIPNSRKSWVQRFIKEVIDPSIVPYLRKPKDETAALQLFDHHYVCILDNLNSIPRALSDIICGVATGLGQESRKLYSNDEAFIRAFRRCVMLNGVNLPTQAGDLISRTILHPTEPQIGSRNDTELMADYKKVLPLILGGFLDVIVKALTIKETLGETKIFRLSDFSEWGAAISVALGKTKKDFVDAMEENLNNQNAADVENNTVADMFLIFVKENFDSSNWTEETPYKKTPQEIFTEVTEKAIAKKINIKSKRWISTPHGFTRKLNESKSSLIALGFHYEIGHDGTQRVMSIWRTDIENPEKKQYCKIVCVNFDSGDCSSDNWRNFTAETEKPLGCPGFKAREKTGGDVN